MYEYSCIQIHEKLNICFFYIGRPRKAIIKQNSSHIICNSSITSQPEKYHNAMKFYFKRDNSIFTQVDQIIPIATGYGQMSNYSCRVREIGSTLLSETSEVITINLQCKPCHMSIIYGI